MQFKVRALSPSQQIEVFSLDAIDAADAKTQVDKKGLNVLAITPISAWDKSQFIFFKSKNQFNKLLFAQELLALISAGLSLVEALDSLLERAAQSSSQAVLQRLRDALKAGFRLSDALGKQAHIFPPLFVGIVQAAEGTSDLPQALERYVAYESKLQSLRHKVISAAIYPGILLGVGFIVALFLLGYVVPRFSAVYQNTSRALPWASQVLLAWGQFAAAYGYWLLAFIGAFILLMVWSVRATIRSGYWLKTIAWIPGLRVRLEILVLTRLYLTLGMLLDGGIPLVRAMQLCEAVLPRHAVAQLQAAKFMVGQGESLSFALQRNSLVTPVTMRLLRVGEKTGQMGLMLARTAAFYDTETTRWIDKFSKAFEPLLMAVIGIVIGIIVILLYMPIFDLAGNI
ncbi:Type II secretion system protein F [Polaromonas vacuolata]|uniref:Type II secretion system protein F n=1 Tax=Polaromonas vacuolata TaxID=37448 RepID=A0A6H2HAS9_9BURK|nr:type II secretion system F family protein [Polaromonas vacuolata]QJC56930.1 Type II secretion system protein F [Polaromonas vacuolata]